MGAGGSIPVRGDSRHSCAEAGACLRKFKREREKKEAILPQGLGRMSEDFEARGGGGRAHVRWDFLIIIMSPELLLDVMWEASCPHLCIPFLPSEVLLAENGWGVLCISSGSYEGHSAF